MMFDVIGFTETENDFFTPPDLSAINDNKNSETTKSSLLRERLEDIKSQLLLASYVIKKEIGKNYIGI